MGVIDFNKVVAYSKLRCVEKSLGKCATYVKNAFKAGGCKYISGNGWDNQSFCKQNGFQCIGDFVPVDKNPRPHNGKKIQFPEGYVQQMGDICLIKHGKYGHICYAMSDNINDWVSDYFQKPPVQLDKTGPYCYKGNYERVQFWRHSSVMDDNPENKLTVQEETIQENYVEVNNTKINKENRLFVSKSVFENDNNLKTSSEVLGMILGTHMLQK